jgi:hypothetical protein
MFKSFLIWFKRGGKAREVHCLAYKLIAVATALRIAYDADCAVKGCLID